MLRESKVYDVATHLAVAQAADLTGSGRPCLVVTFEDCGAHTCFLYVDVLSLEGGRLQSLLAQPLSQSYADLKIEPRHGKPALALHGGQIGSVGAGPVQTRTDYYAWDGRTFALLETVWDLQGAAALYRQVIDAPVLTATGFTDEAAERHTLEAFAYYRLLTVQAALGDRAAAEAALQALQQGYADHPCRALAQAFWDAWQPAGDLGAGCAAAAAYAQAHADALAAAFGDYGYGNPGLDVPDLCFLQ